MRAPFGHVEGPGVGRRVQMLEKMGHGVEKSESRARLDSLSTGPVWEERKEVQE